MKFEAARRASTPRASGLRTRPRGVHKGGERGFALVIAIFVTALVSLMVLSFTASVRSHVGIASNAIGSAAAEAAADAGIALGIARLLSVPASGARRADLSGAFQCALPSGATVSVEITDEGGRVDLNLASRPLLTALLAGLGYGQERARSIAGAIIDYRDTDDAISETSDSGGGSERAAYRAAGRIRGPANAAFETIEDVGAVLGLDARSAERIAPFVTVHSGQGGIDPKKAPRQLVEMLARARESEGLGLAAGSFSSEGLPRTFVAPSSGAAWRVRATGYASGETIFVREAVVTLGQQRPNAPPQPDSKLPESGVRARPAAGAAGRTAQPIAIVNEWRRGTQTSETFSQQNSFNKERC